MVKLKKEEGTSSVLDMIPLIFTIVVVGLLGIAFATWTVNFERKNKVDTIAREYLLRMESNGYLSAEDMANLNNDLQNAHMKNISLSGTTTTEVENGEIITLNIEGELELLNYKILDIFKTESTIENKTISIIKKSTAKSKG